MASLVHEKDLTPDKIQSALGLTEHPKVSAIETSPGSKQYKIGVDLKHGPSVYGFDYRDALPAESQDEAVKAATEMFFSSVKNHHVRAWRDPNPGDNILGAANQFGMHASHLYMTDVAGTPRPTLNPNAEAHAEWLSTDYLVNERITNAHIVENASLGALKLSNPYFDGLEAKGVTMIGTLVVGKGVFKNCDFLKSRWDAAEFKPTDPDHPDTWTRFEKCNLEKASFCSKDGGFVGKVYFDRDCSLVEMNLLHLGKNSTVKIGILDAIIDAERNGRPKAEIDALYAEAKAKLKGLIWDKSMEHAGYGTSYALILEKISVAVDPAELERRLQLSAISRNEIVQELENTPGVRTNRVYSDDSKQEKVVEITLTCGDFEVRVPYDEAKPIRVTKPGGIDLDNDDRRNPHLAPVAAHTPSEKSRDILAWAAPLAFPKAENAILKKALWGGAKVV